MSFDKTTWTSLGITFLAAIASVWAINRTKLQRLFYDKLTQIPALNIFRIFFGIAQTKLPSKNFGRLIFISFIFWCLVMRTAFQGKSFEFTTSAIRKPAMKSLEDLRENNFTLYLPEGTMEPVWDFISDGIE